MHKISSKGNGKYEKRSGRGIKWERNGGLGGKDRERKGESKKRKRGIEEGSKKGEREGGKEKWRVEGREEGYWKKEKVNEKNLLCSVIEMKMQ